MKRYLRIYYQLLRLNLSALITYRVNFVNNVIGSVGWGAMSLLTLILLTARVTNAYGWKREELLLFNGIYGVIIGVFHMFISNNMGRLSRVIHMGELDGILVKPIDSQFAVSLWWVNFATVFRILMAAAFTVYIISVLHIRITGVQVLTFFLLSIASLVLLYSLWFIVLTNLMWLTNLSNLVLFMYSFESMARFPKEMLAQLTGFVFYAVFPLAIVINTPARALLGRISVTDSIWLVVLAAGLWCIARSFWRYALRHYGSASS